jgi:NADP-reducing hydrogenase subunit HndD
MAKKIQIIIDGEKIVASDEQTILEVAKENGIEIPTLCYHSDLDIRSNCQICIVKIKGVNDLQAACRTKIKDKMEISTDSPKIRKARKINLELIFAQHYEECNDCVWRFNCQLLKLAKKYKVKITRFPDRKTNFPVYQFGPSFIFDSSKCIDCRNCVDVCKKQGIDLFEIKNRGHKIQITPSKDKNKDCIYCGQCVVHCPAGALEAVGEFEEIEKPLQEKGKIVIAQFAPAIRTSIGELFNIPYGRPITKKLAAGIKQLGFDKVFDTCVGADFTTYEEADELTKRLKSGKKLPMFASCCPAWVKFVEFYHPEFILHLTTVRSPHIILGGLIKTFWAEKVNIDPKKIVVVSIMPCIAKKYEITRNELKINGMHPVDYVLTTRELAYLLIKHKIDLKKIKAQNLDDPLGISSGAGIIYGATGGVMESALRTAYEKITHSINSGQMGKKLLKLEFKEVRGMEGMRKAKIKINNQLVRLAIINGIGNAQKILKELKNKPHLYDYVEVMACFGGCIGGGGQPVPTDSEIRKARASGLYQVDKTKELKSAHQNPILKKVYKEFFTKKEKIHLVCHTKYFRKKRDRFKTLPKGMH